MRIEVKIPVEFEVEGEKGTAIISGWFTTELDKSFIDKEIQSLFEAIQKEEFTLIIKPQEVKK